MLRRPLGPNAIKDQWLGGLEFQTVFDYGYDGVMRSFEDSLQRLGINRVDLLLIHDLDPWDHNPATLNAYFTQLKTSGWKALAELREGGVIGGIGAGFNSMGSIPRFLDLFDMDFFLLAMRYTLLEQEVLESEFPRCEERGVGIVIGGGYVGLEFAQAMRRFGSRVTMLGRDSQLLPSEDEDVSEGIQRLFEDEGIDLILNATAKRISGRKFRRYPRPTCPAIRPAVVR